MEDELVPQPISGIVRSAEASRSRLLTLDLIFGNCRLEGSLTGNFAIGDATLKFSFLSGISAMIETVPLEQAQEA
jgi:hypothetical protein